LKFKDLFLAPNLITIFRLVVSLLLFFNYEYIEFNNFILILIIALIGVSDAVDGYVARKFNQVSKLGTILDPFIDRIVFVLLIIWLFDLFPNWFFYGILFREFIVLAGSIYVLTSTKTINVSRYGKFGTVLIFISVCFFVLNLSFSLLIFDIFGLLSLFFYYFVALEYLYRLLKDE
tara:strand:+ start:2578 stop:3105 length:528 start_codon:yes stop_codon:yes gene_type:complete